MICKCLICSDLQTHFMNLHAQIVVKNADGLMFLVGEVTYERLVYP
jgi:hypothetical protein